MLKLTSGYKLTITSVEDDVTKEGIEYLKVKGKIYLQAYPFASEKKYLLSNFNNKIISLDFPLFLRFLNIKNLRFKHFKNLRWVLKAKPFLINKSIFSI